jgi:uncharacterized damage-inducible protein DinB
MAMIDAYLQELDVEHDLTRRVIEAIPDDKLTWKPHARSMSLGQLTYHLASIPGMVAELSLPDEVPAPRFPMPPCVSSRAEAVALLAESVAKARRLLAGLSDERMRAVWRTRAAGKEVLALPRWMMLRAILLNHWYQHRGQLMVYLRLLDRPVPNVYGPSADMNPFE